MCRLDAENNLQEPVSVKTAVYNIYSTNLTLPTHLLVCAHGAVVHFPVAAGQALCGASAPLFGTLQYDLLSLEPSNLDATG